MNDTDHQRLDTTEAALRELARRLDSMEQGEFHPGGEGFRIGTLRLFEKLSGGLYHLHQRDEDGTENDLTDALSLQGIPLSAAAPTAAQVLVYDADLDEWVLASSAAPGAHALGGAAHTAATLAELNAKVSDATLDKNTASRPPSGNAGGDLGGTYPNPSVDDGADSTAIHDNVANEITAITIKATPVAADELVIEDSAASFVKKAVTFAAFEGALTHDSLVAGIIAAHDTGATGAELDTLTDGSDADALHDHATLATAVEAVAAVEAANPLDMANAIQVDDIDEHTGAAGVTIDLLTLIKDGKVTPDTTYSDAFLFSNAAGTSVGLDANDYFLFAKATNLWQLFLDSDWRFKVSVTAADFNVPLNMNSNDITAVKTMEVDSTPADDTATGITATFTAGTNLVWGNYCYIGADGKMEKALATAEATSRVVAFCTETVNENASGTFLLQGFIRDDDGLEYTTIGAKIYLSDDTAGAADLTQPAGTDETIVILGIALATRVLYFNPQVQAIVEHV